jgi:hypothetical protein
MIIPATKPAASFSPKIGANSFVATKTVGTKIAGTKPVARNLLAAKLLARIFPHRPIPQSLPQRMPPQRVSAKDIRPETPTSPLLTPTPTMIVPAKFRGANLR